MGFSYHTGKTILVRSATPGDIKKGILLSQPYKREGYNIRYVDVRLDGGVRQVSINRIIKDKGMLREYGCKY